MAELAISYSLLETSATDANKHATSLYDYVSNIKARIITPVNNLNGSDSLGYASAAASEAWSKISNLETRATNYTAYASMISTFVDEAKATDKSVSASLEAITSQYVEAPGFFEGIANAIYNFVCVDLANSNDLTRLLSDAAKWVGNKVSDAAANVYNWFKYGEGQYYLNIGLSIAGALIAVVGVIAAIAAIPFTGGLSIALVVACVAAVAAGFGAAITIANTMATVKANATAISFNDDPGKSQFYGEIESMSDVVAKTDYGDAQDNQNQANIAHGVDNIKTVCDVIGVVRGVTNIAGVKNTLGQVTSYSKAAIPGNLKSLFTPGLGYTSKYDVMFNRKFVSEQTLKNIKTGVSTVAGVNLIMEIDATQDSWHAGDAGGVFNNFRQAAGEIFTGVDVLLNNPISAAEGIGNVISDAPPCVSSTTGPTPCPTPTPIPMGGGGW